MQTEMSLNIISVSTEFELYEVKIQILNIKGPVQQMEMLNMQH